VTLQQKRFTERGLGLLPSKSCLLAPSRENTRRDVHVLTTCTTKKRQWNFTLQNRA
jgi:hypothetical protein